MRIHRGVVDGNHDQVVGPAAVVAEAQPRWFVMENVVGAPFPEVSGYLVHPSLLNNRWLGADKDQNRLHRFCFGTKDGRKLQYRVGALESPRWRARVLAGGSVALRIGGNGQYRLRKLTSRSRAHLRESCRLQGLPEDAFDRSPFTVEAAHKAIGNAVALPMARELAQASTVSIVLVRAFSLPPPAGIEFSYYPADLGATLEAAAKEYLQATAQPGEKYVLMQGDAATAVLEAADQHDAGLIVLTSTGKGLAKRIALGSTTDRVVHSTSRSVLVVPQA